MRYGTIISTSAATAEWYRLLAFSTLSRQRQIRIEDVKGHESAYMSRTRQAVIILRSEGNSSILQLRTKVVLELSDTDGPAGTDR